MEMAILLTEKGYGDFYVTSPYGGWSLNVGAMHEFFKSKGYKFTMRASDNEHNIWHKNHLPFDYEYMMGMIEAQKL